MLSNELKLEMLYARLKKLSERPILNSALMKNVRRQIRRMVRL